MMKHEVRELASKLGLVTAEKRDSQGLCFIGKVRLPEFLQQKLEPRQGVIVQIPGDSLLFGQQVPSFSDREEELKFLSEKFKYRIEDGKEVGLHQGAHYFTKGQRKGLAVGGTPEPLFVIETDVKENVIYVGEGKQHPGLFRMALYIREEELHWIRKDLALEPGEEMEVEARIRYRQPLQKAILLRFDRGAYLLFEQPQSAITEGQFAAWYREEELLGSGVIS